MAEKFSFASTPHLHFGAGKLAVLPAAVTSFGKKALLVTGARSFLASRHAETLFEQLISAQVELKQYRVAGEPSPETVDAAVNTFRDFGPDCVIAIGGGSALDAGKAISAMLPLRTSVKEYLEGIGSMPHHPGTKVPFVAVPTTSGTGSEATKNAVISEVGEQGYKRSLRHDNFVPDMAVIDPRVTIDCPKAITASSGMDAFTQLLESFLSAASNPISDVLAEAGLTRIAKSLPKAFADGTNLQARTDMALASYLSGVTLASAGLGVVHGFASPLGGYFEIPHGVICSRLMGPANRITVRKLREQQKNPQALTKYARAGKIFTAKEGKSDDYNIDSLLDIIESWTEEMNIPSLSLYSVKPEHFDKIISATGNKNNPVALDRDEMYEVLQTSIRT